MARVDLFFGAGGRGTAAWTAFLSRVVTPRFPAGLTALEGRGRWRDAGDHVAMEPTHILTLYYHPDATSDARIEAIRTLYKRQFHQLSVLRADSFACVSF